MLKDITHCSIQFTYAATMQTAMEDALALPDSKVEGTTVSKTGTLHAHLDIDHVLGSSITLAEQDILGGAFRDSYNLIHSGNGYTVTDVELVRRVDIPETAATDSSSDFYNRIWTIKAHYDCEKCGRLPPVFTLERGLHKAFEDLVCLKLNASGLQSYAKASDCEIAFALNDVEEAFQSIQG